LVSCLRSLVGQVSEGMKRDGADFVLPLERGAVQRLDVREHLVDDDAAGVDVVARQSVKHEGIVGVGTMRDGNPGVCHGTKSPLGKSYAGHSVRTTLITRS